MNVTSDEVPVGRFAESFTFTHAKSGGPRFTYQDTTRFEESRGPKGTALTLPSIMAVSGAALAPLMGRFTFPPLRLLMALTNVRLGVWVRNPRHPSFDARPERPHGRLGRLWASIVEGWREPGALYVLREAVGGLTLTKRRFIYLTDGGHWENLGLVELLRRRCTQILCFDASTDADGAATDIGRAIALARSELGADIVLDPAPTMPRDGTHSADLAVLGEVRYPDGDKARLVYAKAALTEDLSWDLRSFHHRDSRFPHHSLSRQIFTDEQFEAYRSLGHAAGRRAAAVLNLPAMTAVDEGKSRAMSRQRRRDTGPELAVRQRLHALGYRYRVDHRPLPDLRARGDLVFTRARVVVFVDGCFWHRCPQHATSPAAQRGVVAGQARRQRRARPRHRPAARRRGLARRADLGARAARERRRADTGGAQSCAGPSSIRTPTCRTTSAMTSCTATVSANGITSLCALPAATHSVTSISSCAYPPPVRGRVDGLLGVAAVQHDRVRVVEAGQHVDPALGAEHPQLARRRAAQRAEQRRRPAAREAQEHRLLQVDAGVGERALRVDGLRVAQQHLRERDRVDREVEHRAAADGRVEEAVGRVRVGLHAQLALHRADLAERAVGDQLAQPHDDGLEAGPHGLHGERAGRRGQLDDLPRGLRRDRERLLHEDRLARPQRRERDRAVLGVGGGDVEDVDAVVVEDGLVGVVRPGDVVRVGERLRALGGAGGHRHELRVRHERRVADHLRRDAARPDDTPANGHVPILVDQPTAAAQVSHTARQGAPDRLVHHRAKGRRGKDAD